MPSKTLTLTFTPQREDYVKCIRAYQLRDRRIAIAFGLLALEVICFSGLYIAGILGDNPVILLAVAPLPLAGLYLFAVMPWLVGRRIAASMKQMTEVVWRVSDEGLSIRSASGKRTLPWTEFRALLPTREHLLLFYRDSPKTFQFVPRRAFTSPDQELSFYEMARQGITGRSPAAPVQNPDAPEDPPAGTQSDAG